MAGSSAAKTLRFAEADARVAPVGVGVKGQRMSRKEAVHLRAVAGAEFAQVPLDVILVIGVQEIEELPGAVRGGNRVGAVLAEVAATRGAR